MNSRLSGGVGTGWDGYGHGRGGLWDRLPGLAPGQAVVAFPHLTRPLLVSIDPAPCQLRMTD